MLAVQDWLIENNFNYSLLESELAITANFNENDDRVILNYNQIDSPKYNDIVRNCRGIVLNRRDANLIGRSFHRFFNWGEDLPAMKTFNWDNCFINSKEDGSLITIYKFNGQWRVNTRNSFGEGIVNNSGYTWIELVQQALPFNLNYFDTISDGEDNISFVFELCSPFNQIVRTYDRPQLFLLAIFSNCEYGEWSVDAVDNFAKQYGFQRPFTIKCMDPFEVTATIAKIAEKDRTFEGFVLRDCHNTRFKFKSQEYLQLHRLSNNGNVASVKNLVPIALSGETDEVVNYFPYIQDRLLLVQKEIDKIKVELDSIFYCNWDKPSRKKFAEVVKSHPFSCVLFELYGKRHDEVDISAKIREYESKLIDYIEKVVK